MAAQVPDNYVEDDWNHAEILNDAPADAHTEANRFTAMSYCLGQCGLSREEICTLYSFGGYTSLRDFLEFDENEINDNFKAIARAPTDEAPRGMKTLNLRKRTNVLVLKHWVFTYYREDRLDDLSPGDFDEEMIRKMKVDREHLIRSKEEEAQRKIEHLKPLKETTHYPKWAKSVENHFRSIIGALGIVLFYVIRPVKTEEEIDAMDPEEQTIYRARHSGPEYEEDKKFVFQRLFSVVLQSHASLFEWTKGHDRRQDGRGLWMSISSNLGGTAMVDTKKSAAQKVLDTLYYKGEHRTLSWEDYTSKLQGAFHDLDEAGYGLSLVAKRDKIFHNIKFTSNTIFNSHLTYIEKETDRYPNFQSVSTAVASTIANMISKGQWNHGRNIHSTESDGRNGKDKGGGGRGGGRGRGRGRGGGGGRGRGGSGRGSGNYDNDRWYIRGVDVTDPHRSFSDQEMKQLGRAGQAAMYNMRANTQKQDSNGYNKRTATVAFQETDTSPKDDSETSDKKNDKGSQNGNKFGRNGRSEKKKDGEQ